jgi:hypothetical protein
MKPFLVFILSCASVYGADDSIKVVSSTKTDKETAIVSTEDVFTRDGKTNLVRDTRTKAGKLQIRIHRFYHEGSLVAEFDATTDSSGFTTTAGTPYSASVEFDAAQNLTGLVIGTKDGFAADEFKCTDGTFSPVESSVLQKGNAMVSDVKKLFDPDHVRKTSPERFGEEARELVEKHQEK